MFSTIIEKIYADVRDMKDILLSDLTKAEDDIRKRNFQRVNFKAGSHIRKHFQTIHDEVNQLNRTNCQLSDNCAQEIQLIHRTSLLQSKNLADITMLFNYVSGVVEKCNDQLETLKITFESVELGLINLEETINQIERHTKETVL